MITLFLALVMLLSLTACGGSASVEAEVPETAPAAAPTEAPTEAPTTEPTLSPEEVLYHSLPDRMKQAVDVGIVELSQLEDLNRIVTVGEASEMLQKAYVHRTGVESKTLNELISREEFSSRMADRAWISLIPGRADLELAYGDKFENYEQWAKYLGKNWSTTGDLWASFDNRLGIWSAPIPFDLDGYQYVYDADSDSIYVDPFGEKLASAADYSEFWEAMQADALYAVSDDAINYGFKVYDSTNGKKFISMEDGYFNGLDTLTIEEAVECALVYYNFLNPMDYPTYLAPEEVGAYNPEIITPELLNKETSLPAASCENLPAQWHGVVMDDMELVAYNMHTDPEIYEYEIQKVKEAGFNFIGLNLDFSWLQDYWLFDSKSNGGNLAYNKMLTNKKDSGKLSLERLEKLDQVIALCMKYDIHVDLRATALGELSGYSMDLPQRVRKGANYADELAQLWQAVARRYAEIPNEYLSFTLFTADLDVQNGMLLPSVEAIREVSPDRCIIADICFKAMKSKEFAELGVALSYRLYDHEKYDSVMNMTAYYKQNSARQVNRLYFLTKQGENVIENFSWPYKGELNAKILFSKGRYGGESLMEVMEIAQEYGVGFMLSDFGVTVDEKDHIARSRLRYADEPYFAMIEDITSTMEEMGYGWCFAHWYSPYGVAFCIPAIQSSTYEQVEDYPYYIDQGMMGLFQTINGMK